MSNTDRDSMLERWADGMETLEQYYENLYGPPATPAILPNITDRDGMLAAIADEMERARININKHSTTYHDTNAAYIKTVPENVKSASIEQIGGKTIVWNQICKKRDASQTGVTPISDNECVIDGEYTSVTYPLISNEISTVAGHKYYSVISTNNSIPGTIHLYNNNKGVSVSINSSTQKKSAVQTATGEQAILLRIGAGTYNTTLRYAVYDLTVMFGAGNEPTAAEFEAMFPVLFYPFNAGTLMSAGVTEVVSKYSNNETLQTYSIHASVQALAGYGWSAGNVYNYVDIEAKKYVQAIGSRAYASGDESDSTVITDKTTTYYPLTTPVETDVSQYLDDNLIKAESGGTLTFSNSNGDDYRIPVPSTETFWVDIS